MVGDPVAVGIAVGEDAAELVERPVEDVQHPTLVYGQGDDRLRLVREHRRLLGLRVVVRVPHLVHRARAEGVARVEVLDTRPPDGGQGERVRVGGGDGGGAIEREVARVVP